MNLSLKPVICPKVLFVTGLGRAGKSMLAPLVSNLDRVEYYQVIPAVDHIPCLWMLGLLDGHTATALLRMTVDVAIYDRLIGRNVNARLSDSTSIHNALDPAETLVRSFNPDGMAAVEKFNGKGRIPCISTHFAMCAAPLFFRAFPEARILHHIRHPLDVAESSRQRGWGERFGVDPTAFSFSVTTESGADVPWFAANNAQEYKEMDPTNRVVWMILRLLDKNESGAKELDERHQAQVLTTTFERLASTPVDELARVAEWLETEIPSTMPIAMTKERVPRVIPMGDRTNKAETLRQLTTPELFEQLMAASKRYEDAWIK